MGPGNSHAPGAQRLAILESYGLPGAADDGFFRGLVELAASLCQTPIAYISYLDDRQECFQASQGFDFQTLPLELAICAHLALEPSQLLIPDLTADPRFAQHPLAQARPALRFYAGVPLRSPEGIAFGGLCVMDHQPRHLAATQLEQLQRLAGQLLAYLNLRREKRQIEREKQRFQIHQERLYHISYNLALSQAEFLDAGMDVLCDYFGLSSASVTRVQGGVYELLAVRNPATLAQGQRFEAGKKIPLAGSLVGQIFDQDEVLSLDQLIASSQQSAALAARYQIGALIAAPFWLNDRAHGVVACFSFGPDAQTFEALDREFMRVFCRWLGFMKEKRFFVEHLQKLSTGKDRLLAVVAHDLRNSLTAIITAKRQLDRSLAAEQTPDARMLTIIESAYQHGQNLLDELLEAAELEQAHVQLPLEPLNLVSFVRESLSYFEPLAAAKQLSLRLQAEQDLLLVALNPRKMLRVFENLLNNALKFTPPGGKIELGLFQLGQTAQILVEDTGIGIPEHLQQVLFDKYSAARRQGLQGERSNGLGMYIVREIVQLHGGQIRVLSRVEQGSCFQIELPLVLDINRQGPGAGKQDRA